MYWNMILLRGKLPGMKPPKQQKNKNQNNSISQQFCLRTYYPRLKRIF